MRRRRALVTVVVAAALVLAACSSGDDDASERPEPRPDDTPVTQVVDYSGVALPGVDGTTTTTGPRETGTASIIGTITGPSGFVGGATVRIERLLDGREVRTDVLTGPDGRYELRNIPGGRYRVRAFLAPAHALVAPDVRFLRDGEEHVFDLRMEDQRGVVARASVAPDPPVLEQAVNLVAVVATRTVDLDGTVRSTPVIGVRVELSGLGRWSFRSLQRPSGRPLLSTTTSTTVFRQPQIAITDALGQVRFELQCDVPGPAGLTLLVPVTVQPEAVEGQPPLPPTTRTESIALEVPDCVDPTVTTAPPTDGSTGATVEDGE